MSSVFQCCFCFGFFFSIQNFSAYGNQTYLFPLCHLGFVIHRSRFPHFKITKMTILFSSVASVVSFMIWNASKVGGGVLRSARLLLWAGLFIFVYFDNDCDLKIYLVATTLLNSLLNFNNFPLGFWCNNHIIHNNKFSLLSSFPGLTHYLEVPEMLSKNVGFWHYFLVSDFSGKISHVSELCATFVSGMINVLFLKIFLTFLKCIRHF